MRKKKLADYTLNEDAPLPIVSDYEAVYMVPEKIDKKNIAVKNFSYHEFKKIADKAPFTLGEWADLLYMSERTLHRYAKEGSDFNGLQIERILLLEKLVNAGNKLFNKDDFKAWLLYKPFSLSGITVKESLATHAGIENVIHLIERLQHGISA